MSTKRSPYKTNNTNYKMPPPYTSEEVLDALREGKRQAMLNNPGQQVYRITLPQQVSEPQPSRQHPSGWKAAIVKYFIRAKAFFTV
jgi:hypothetical protein